MAPDADARKETSITRHWSRRWMVALLFGLLFAVYFTCYLTLCWRGTTRDMKPALPTWLNDHLLVRTPPGTSDLFFPAACMEACLRGCWRGILLVNNDNNGGWNLTTHPWGYIRTPRSP